MHLQHTSRVQMKFNQIKIDLIFSRVTKVVVNKQRTHAPAQQMSDVRVCTVVSAAIFQFFTFDTFC